METQNSQETNSSEDQTPPKKERSPSPSPLSSPSHEFSFTITLHAPPTSSPHTTTTTTTLKRSNSPSFALDLAPADDIFFRGHLLPLHLLSHHPPLSPRPSTTDISIDDLALTNHNQHPPSTISRIDDKERKKSNSSLLSRLSKWVEDKKKKKKVFDIKHFFKKYASMIEPRLFFSRGEEKGKRDLRRRPYSFSGNSNPKERDKWMRRRGEFSAPASMTTSPTNSGLLLATPAGYSSSNESSMEELQSAIQAAIAHCKNSTATKERKSL